MGVSHHAMSGCAVLDYVETRVSDAELFANTAYFGRVNCNSATLVVIP
jgi:hypothetical protein